MDRYGIIKRAGILGIVLNLFLGIIKVIVAFMSGSEAMMADALNSTGDVFSSLMTIIGNKIASKPRDKDHNLGHGKAEYIYSLIISIVMILTGITLLKNNIVSLILNKTYEYSVNLIVVCIVTIVVKLFLYLYTSYLSKRESSVLLKANSKDHQNDMFITFLNLISVIFAKYNIFIVDKIVGISIAVYIIITSFIIFKEGYDVLMDKSISNDTYKKVMKIIKGYPEIKKVQHFNSTPVGYRYQISFTIFVDGKMSTYDSHEIANRLEKDISKNIEEIYLTVVHVNPIDIEE